MKIIKVVHAEGNKQLDREKQAFAIQTYDVEEFFKKRLLKERGAIDYLLSGISGTLLGGFVYNEINLVKKIRETGLSIVNDIRTHLEELEVISLDFAQKKYPRTDNLSVGTYALHPYDSARLTRLESYHTNLAMEKDDELIVLLGKMGAKTISIMECAGEETSSNGNLNVTNIEGQLNVSKKLGTGKELIVSFEGNIVDINPDLLSTSLWFSTDSKLHSILESRRFNPNKIQQYTLRNTYTESFDFDFEIAGKFLAVKADLKSQYNSLRQKERLFHVEFSRVGKVGKPA